MSLSQSDLNVNTHYNEQHLGYTRNKMKKLKKLKKKNDDHDENNNNNNNDIINE